MGVCTFWYVFLERRPELLSDSQECCAQGRRANTVGGAGGAAWQRVRGGMESRWFPGGAVLRGGTLSKYLRSDICWFHKLACRSTVELQFLFSHGRSPRRNTHACYVPGDLAAQLSHGDSLPSVPHPQRTWALPGAPSRSCFSSPSRPVRAGSLICLSNRQSFPLGRRLGAQHGARG